MRGYDRLLSPGGSGLQAGADRSTCPCPGSMDGVGVGCISVGLGVPVGPGRFQLTFPTPEYMMELYDLVQAQDQAQVCPDLDLSDCTSLGHTWSVPSRLPATSPS